VKSVPTTGGLVQTIASNQESPNGLAIDGPYVYWSNHLGAAIKRTLKDGSGSPELVSEASMPTTVGVYGDHVYWFDDSQAAIWQVPKAGGTATNVLTYKPDSAAPTYLSFFMAKTGVYYWTFVAHGTPTCYSLLDGWSVRGLAYDDFGALGPNLYHQPCGTSSTAFCFDYELLDPATGKPTLIFRPWGSDPSDYNLGRVLLAANSCGIFVSTTTADRTRSELELFPLAPINSSTRYSLGGFTVGVRTSDEENLYFFSGTSIYKLPVP